MIPLLHLFRRALARIASIARIALAALVFVSPPAARAEDYPITPSV